MQGTMTVAELRAALTEFADDAPVMIGVVKYPGEFAFRKSAATGEWRWDTGTDTEIIPLEADEIRSQDGGQCWLVVELDEYNAERAMLNEAGAGAA